MLSFCLVGWLDVFPLMEKAECSGNHLLMIDLYFFFFWMRCSSPRAPDGLVMLGLVFKWFPLWEFSLFDTPQG